MAKEQGKSVNSNNKKIFDVFLNMKNIFCLFSVLKNKIIEYKKVIIFCGAFLFVGLILGIIFTSIYSDEREIVLIEENFSSSIFRFSCVLFLVMAGIFVSSLNYYLNILNPISIIFLGYFFGKFISLTFTYNLLNALFSIVFFCLPMLLLSLIYVIFLTSFLVEDYFSRAVNLCNTKEKLAKMLVSYLIASAISILQFWILADVTNAVDFV